MENTKTIKKITQLKLRAYPFRISFVFLEGLLCARHFFECHKYIISFNPQKNSMEKLLLVSLFLQMRKLRQRQDM